MFTHPTLFSEIKRIVRVQSLIPLLAVAVSLVTSAPRVDAVEITSSKADQLRRGHQAGIRLGVWSNSGQLPASDTIATDFAYIADLKDASFYAEAYLGIRVWTPLMVEFAVGMANRGDVTVRSFGYSYYGNISVYPVSVRLKLYPVAAIRSPFQPYLLLGGGLHIGKNNIQFSDDYYAAYNERSVTDINMEIGGGLDWPLSSRIALDLQANYLPTKFSKEMFGEKDYSGVAVTVGIKWLLPTLRGKQEHGR